MEDDFYGDDQEHEILQQEWKAREAQFKTLGYRDGVTAGKDQTLQQGFNSGFQESIQPGYDWGRARGLTSALLTLGSNVSLIVRPEAEAEIAQVGADVAAISTEAALRHFSAAASSQQVSAESSQEKEYRAQESTRSVPLETSPVEASGSSLDKCVVSVDEQEGQSREAVVRGTLEQGTSSVKDTARRVNLTNKDQLLQKLEARVSSLISYSAS